MDLQKLRQKNLTETKTKIKESVSDDLLIIQCINNFEDIDRCINTLSKRLREWYELYLPEISKEIVDHEQFIDLILRFDKNTLIQKHKIQQTMGADLSKEDIKPIFDLAKEIKELFQLRNSQEKYLTKQMEKLSPRLTKLAGATIGAKLISHAGSFKNLAKLPSSTIQLLGAEKALFRHLKNKKNKCPKFGCIHEHQLIQKAKKDEKGKVARHLASKINIAIKVDYFRK